MRILVVGAGAVGGLFGGLMAAHGRDVTFLVRPARAEALRTNGLNLVGIPGGSQDEVRTVPVAALTAEDLTTDEPEPFDVVMLAVKAYGLDSAIDDIAPAMAAGAAVLPRQVVDRLAQGENPLRVLREWRCLTQMHLSSRTNLSQGYISDIENGRRTGTAEALRLVANVLKVPLDLLA